MDLRHKHVGSEAHLKGVGGGEKGHQNNTAERVSLSFSVIRESELN